MLAKLKTSIQQSFIYSLGSVAAKAVGVILLPLYLHNLSVAAFGVWDLLDTTIQILTEIVILGQASAIIFLNNTQEYKEKKSSTLYTLTVFVLLLGSLLVLITEAAAFYFPSLLSGSLVRIEYIRLSAYIILLRVMSNLFFAKVRAEEEAKFYTAISVVRVFLITAFSVYFIAIRQLEILGGLYGFLFTEVIITGILTIKVIPQMKPKFNREILSKAVKFGFPLVFSSLGFMLLNLSDRYIIKILLGAADVGIYGLGYRVAGVLNMFLILPFSLSLMPLAYKYFGKHDDKRFYSKLMTYSTFMFVWGFVFISLFSPEIVRLVAGKGNYDSAFLVVPIILLSYVFSGMRLTVQLGMLLTNNTKYIAWITLSAALLNIVLNFLFIPMFGIIAAAVNTLISFVLFYCVSQFISDKHFKIPYENGKLVLMIIVGSVLSCSVYVITEIGIVGILFKLFLTAIFPVVLFAFKFYEKAELEILLNPHKLKDFLFSLFSGNKNAQAEQIVEE
ncbi:MAG: polysaccharide biosynthesis protein [Ignavibacteria bacterium]|nr:MAG: polysaccharide biosynthesis protein [Ignavibacteria bacterium]KAF0156539.1 MAG: polysaccharide biosynthesis protein [Ignavibacteria bacterium]